MTVKASAAATVHTAHQDLTKPWMPKLWHGMDFFAWWRLLRKNHFAVEWRRAHTAVAVTGFSVANTSLRWLQELCYGRRLRATEIQDPIFIIGHYRTGTTLLHELMALDERLTFPTTYECFSPNHFLLTEAFVSRFFGFLLPAKRLQDNMHQGWGRPQEDESALLNRGAATPYARCAFPNHAPPYPGAEDLRTLPREQREQWMQVLEQFLRQVTYLRPRPIVVKSPLHTCRVPTLLEMFPRARFLYTVREPQAVFSSTCKLWRVIYENQGFQKPNYVGLEDDVLDTMRTMHQRAEEARGIVPAGQFAEVRYEDLVEQPVTELNRIYGELGLGELGEATAAVESYFAGNRDYRTNRHQLDAEQAKRVADAMGDYSERHGYLAGVTP